MVRSLFLFAIVLLPPVSLLADDPDYARDVAPVLRKYCAGCHNSAEANAELRVDQFALLMRGGENGAVIVPGQPDKSKLLLVVEKRQEPFMPPEGNTGPKPGEIALLRRWIAAGAKGPAADDLPVLEVPRIPAVGAVRKPVHAVAYSADGQWMAIARYGDVEILKADGKTRVALLAGHAGHVNDVGFSADGKLLFVAAGEAGIFGEATLWTTDGWQRSHTLRGHRDALYAAALTADGHLLATGSYDQVIRLWDTESGKEIGTLAGHNGPIFDLSFHPAGRILASASDDYTVKLWDVNRQRRLDTLIEPTKATYAVAIRPDGKQVVAAGADNRIRVWNLSASAREGTNGILYSRFAHEAPIVRLAFSPDGSQLVTAAEDNTLKVWETQTYTQLRAFKEQSDWASALAVSPADGRLLVGRLDGTISLYVLGRDMAAGSEPDRPIVAEPLPAPRAVAVAAAATMTEREPNDQIAQAVLLSLPGSVEGVLQPNAGLLEDVDCYRIEAKRGEAWIVETMAGRRKSPADTKVEILHADGRPVERLWLRAVRDSAVTFRPIDSTTVDLRVTNWEEMQLNQYMYLNGEVCQLYRMPQGPDSGFNFYAVNGKRKCYFDTSATIHALDEPVYIVEPYLPGAKFPENGLPVFRLPFANDDDGDRELGNDSRLTFTAPADGTYCIRVTDVRGFGGEDFKYTLVVRAPQPDFQVTVEGRNLAVPAGSGQRVTFKLNRKDNFDGPVNIDIENVPAGFYAPSPIVIEAGHLEARGMIHAAADLVPVTNEEKLADDAPVTAPQPLGWDKLRIVARAVIHGREVTQELGNLGEIRVAPRPKFVVHLAPDESTTGKSPNSLPPLDPGIGPDGIPEIVIEPGTTVTAMLTMQRHDFAGEMKFNVENLPHGVIVDNIGLSGVLIREGETHRQVFLTAYEWVPESSRLVYAVSLGEGNQSSFPIRLTVRRAMR